MLFFCDSIIKFLNHCHKIYEIFGKIYIEDTNYNRQMETSQEILKKVEGIQEQINYEVEGLKRHLNICVGYLLKNMEKAKKFVGNRHKLLKQKKHLKSAIEKMKAKKGLDVSEHRGIYENNLKLDEVNNKLETFDMILASDLQHLEDKVKEIGNMLSLTILFSQLRIQYLLYTSAENIITPQNASDLGKEAITDCFIRAHAQCLSRVKRIKLVQYMGQTAGNNQLYQALYNFEPQKSGDLSLVAGDLIKLISAEGNWWKGLRIKDGVVGNFPSNYVFKKSII